MEGIRAVAVVMVVLFHAGVRWAVGGYLGVDVFLVISGYRIIGHLMAVGSQTASECAEAVGASPSNCSYHLRELAVYLGRIIDEKPYLTFWS